MPYKFLNASMPIQKSPKNSFTDDFQENLDREFKVSSDWYTIQEEYPFASKTYINIDVRVNHAINTRTGISLGDDYKILMFQNLNHIANVGNMYYFDSNYWIVINSEGIKSLAASCTVKRCNNVLRWLDPETGGILTQPCSVDYNIRENRDYATAGSSLVLPSGIIEVTTQFNTTTNKILSNQRFLFGNQNNWTGYKVMGGGVNNYNGLATENNSSSGVIKLTMSVAQANPDTDDFILGVADTKENIFILTLNKSSLNIESGETLPLVAQVMVNGVVTVVDLLWSSNNLLVATVNSSGVVTAVSSGTATIRCEIDGNSLVFDTCPVTVIGTPVSNYEIIISPSSNSILEGDTQVYTSYLYLNGIVQADVFVFSVDVSNTVPASKYSYTTISGNSFSVTNTSRYLNATLKIKCESGIHSRILSILLKGAW